MTRYWQGLWRLADPKISLTSVASMYLGIAVAARQGPIAWDWLAIAGIAFFCMEVAKNAWGDVFDFDTGVDLAVAEEDRTNFSGGKRVMVDQLLSRGQTWGIAIGFGLVGVACGVAIVFLREPAVMWLGIVGLAMGWSYHGPPLRLAYRGFGELDVVIIYGPVIALATYMILANQPSMEVVLVSLPLGLYIAAFLWVNEFPDFDADRTHGKFNLVARLGKRRASRALPFIYFTAAALTLSLPAFGLSPGVVWGLIATPAAVYASLLVWREPDSFHRHAPAQPAALVAFLLYSAGAGSGVLLGR